jgi:hypothetical protein
MNEKQTVKENPNVYLFLSLAFIIISIILIIVELDEYGFFQ